MSSTITNNDGYIPQFCNTDTSPISIATIIHKIISFQFNLGNLGIFTNYVFALILSPSKQDLRHC